MMSYLPVLVGKNGEWYLASWRGRYDFCGEMNKKLSLIRLPRHYYDKKL